MGNFSLCESCALFTDYCEGPGTDHCTYTPKQDTSKEYLDDDKE